MTALMLAQQLKPMQKLACVLLFVIVVYVCWEIHKMGKGK